MPNILLVDGHDLARTTLAAMLQKQGHGVVTAPTAEEGLVASRGTAFDLVVTETRNGVRGGGEEFLSQLREQGATCPVIVLSGGVGDWPENAEKAALLKAGFDGVFCKPPTMEALREMVEVSTSSR